MGSSGSNPAEGMDFDILYLLCVVYLVAYAMSLITLAEESYRMYACMYVCIFYLFINCMLHYVYVTLHA
jgi:hypothetical protein